MAVTKGELDRRIVAQHTTTWEDRIDTILADEYDGTDAEIVIGLSREDGDVIIPMIETVLVDIYRKAGWHLSIINPTETDDGAIIVAPVIASKDAA